MWPFIKVKAFYPLRDPLAAEQRINMDRPLNMKPNVENSKNVSALMGKDIDITDDTSFQIGIIKRRSELLELCAYDGTAFARTVSQIDGRISSEISFNGLLRVVHRDPETKTFTAYIKQVPALRINNKIPISEKAEALLAGEKIIKITHKKGQLSLNKNDVEEITFQQMVDSLETKLFSDDDDVPTQVKKAAREHLRWLFNNKSNGEEIALECTKSLPKEENDAPIKPVSATDRLEAIKIIIKDEFLQGRDIEIPEANPDLIKFYRGCVLPPPSYVINRLAPL